MLRKSRFKFVVCFFLVSAIILSSAASAFAVGEVNVSTLKIAIMSDTHYLSPDMIKDTSDYTDHLNSDRKIFTESDAILDELIECAKKDNPDVVLITGDLTKDGELECHKSVNAKLEQLKSELPGVHIYVVPGNHDIRNSNGVNFNTSDGKAVSATRTEPTDFVKNYTVTFQDDSIVERFTPPQGKEAGYCSYVARPKQGYTFIAIDSARYSSDNTSTGENEHETSGQVSAELENWVTEKIIQAKKRGDTVIGIEHHGLVPHFTMESELMPMYLVNDFERISERYADAGMDYIFTGHMHANDISKLTTPNGNTIYDIETGSALTYPCPERLVVITRTINGDTVEENFAVSTKTGMGPITYKDVLTGTQKTIDNLSDYAKAYGLTREMLTSLPAIYIEKYCQKFLDDGGIKVSLEKLANQYLADTLSQKNITFDGLVDEYLPKLLPGKDSGCAYYYDEVKQGIVIAYNSGELGVNFFIPKSAVKQSLDALFQRVDETVLKDPSKLCKLISDMVEDVINIKVSGEKDLLEYINFIYQSHLAGEDSGDWPQWVKQATQRVESGEIISLVIGIVVDYAAELVDSSLKGVAVEDVLGSDEWSPQERRFVTQHGREALLVPEDTVSSLAVSLVFQYLGAENTGTYKLPNGSAQGQFSIYDLISAFNKYFNFSSKELLNAVVNGAVLSDKIDVAGLKNKLNTLAVRTVYSMGRDTNMPDDNNTVIENRWNLSTYGAKIEERVQNSYNHSNSVSPLVQTKKAKALRYIIAVSGGVLAVAAVSLGIVLVAKSKKKFS